jgi:hypothetical protein
MVYQSSLGYPKKMQPIDYLKIVYERKNVIHRHDAIFCVK